MANYYNAGTRRRTGGTADRYIMQGLDPGSPSLGLQRSLTWFDGQAILGEVGATMPAAMAGAQLDSGKLEAYVAYDPTSHSKRAVAYWHEYTTTPDSMMVYTSRYIGEFHIPVGGWGSIQLPPACLQAIRDGTFAGVAYSIGSTHQRYALGLGWDIPWQRPNIVLNYQR
jgi:hypothetical protein